MVTPQPGIVRDAESILETLRQHRDALRAFGVTEIGLFGSYVRGEQRPDSDIDILFEMTDMTWDCFNDLWDYLENLFGISIDLAPKSQLRPELRPYVLREVRYVANL